MHSNAAKSLEICSELNPSRSEFMVLAPDRLWSEDVEKAIAGESEGEMGMKGYCDWGSWWVLAEKRSFKNKALDLLCSVCTGYVVKPEAGGFYPNKE